MTTSRATIPSPSTKISAQRSLAATTLSGPRGGTARRAREAAARRLSVITSSTPRMTSSATPMTTRSCHNGPFQPSPVTAPCSPVSPRTTSRPITSTGGQ